MRRNTSTPTRGVRKSMQQPSAQAQLRLGLAAQGWRLSNEHGQLIVGNRYCKQTQRLGNVRVLTARSRYTSFRKCLTIGRGTFLFAKVAVEPVCPR